VQVSALGADSASGSDYARSKAAAEDAVMAAHPNAVILRPSVLFGQGDSFFNRFASLARALPVLPLAGAGTRFQPAHAADVAEVVARAVDGSIPGGRVYELGGPEIKTLRECVEYVLAVTGRRRMVLDLPFGAARLQARALEIADMLLLGFLPDSLKLTQDQVALLATDNVVSRAASAEGRTFEGLGIQPTALEAIVPGYLVRFRKAGQFAVEGPRGLRREGACRSRVLRGLDTVAAGLQRARAGVARL
jgi:NADH dehydrogenase